MPRPVCVTCQREMRAAGSGAVSFFAKAIGNARPYQQYQGDVFICEGCGAHIVARFGDHPSFEHFNAGAPDTAVAKSYER